MSEGRQAAESFSFRVLASVDAIEPASLAAEAWLTVRGATGQATYLVRLAIEELVTNCIKYGFDAASEHGIDVALSIRDHILTMLIVDDGHPFNPLMTAPPDLSLPLEERPIGGLGIHLLRNLADDVRYERRDGTNRLTLIKGMA